MELKPGYKRTEVGVIPEDWEVKPLGEMGNFKNGINKAIEDFGYGSPFVNLMDVFGIPRASATTEGLGLINTTEAERNAYALRAGDVLFVRSSVKPQGVGLTTLIPSDLPETVFSGFLIRFRSSGRLANQFKEHCFHGTGFRKRLIASSTVSANTNINQLALSTLSIAFPPVIAEQHAIATALSDADALITKLDQLIAKKRDIKQAAMQQLLTGKTRLPGFSGEWEVKRLGALLKFQVGFPFSSRYFTSHTSGLRLVKNRDLKADDEVVYYDGPHHNDYVVSDGDILIGMDGDFLPCRWNKGVALLNQRVGRLYAAREVDLVFACYFLVGALKEIERATSSTTVKHLSHGDVEGIQAFLPALAEQTAIANVLSDLDAELAALEARRDKMQALKQGMMQVLLTGQVRLPVNKEPMEALA